MSNETPTIDRLQPIELVPDLQAIADRYDVILCDVWGVLHDGITAFPAAGDALARYREGGGRVVLVSNAPRPGAAVASQLDGLGTPRSAYDAVVTSGDVTRAAVAAHGSERLFHLGPDRDLGLFEGLEARSAPLAEADYVVCTGLFDDERETVSDYVATLDAMRRSDLLMICANPDVVVERGERLIPCAGALAAAYEAIGGCVYTGGKPHAPIYDAALAQAAGLLGRPLDRARVLAVGDAIRTDVAGAQNAGLDCLMIARGIHAAELGIEGGLADPRQALAWLARQPARPTALAVALTWTAAGR